MSDHSLSQPQGLDLDSIKAREAAATKGPWTYERLSIHERARAVDGPTETHGVVDAEVAGGDAFQQHGRHVCGFASTRGKYEREEANGIFVAAARTDIPNLIAEVERLRAALRSSRTPQDLMAESFTLLIQDMRSITGTIPASAAWKWAVHLQQILAPVRSSRTPQEPARLLCERIIEENGCCSHEWLIAEARSILAVLPPSADQQSQCVCGHSYGTHDQAGRCTYGDPDGGCECLSYVNKSAADQGAAQQAGKELTVQADDYWTFSPGGAHHDEEFPAHDFQTRFPGTLKEHPHCVRCHVPQGSSESKWRDGRCTLRTFLTVPAHVVKAAALSSPPLADSPTCAHVWKRHLIISSETDEPVIGEVCGRCGTFQPSAPSASAAAAKETK